MLLLKQREHPELDMWRVLLLDVCYASFLLLKFTHVTRIERVAPTSIQNQKT